MVILNCASGEELRREVRKGQLLIVPKWDLLLSAVVTASLYMCFTIELADLHFTFTNRCSSI